MPFRWLLAIYVSLYAVFGVIERGWVFYIPPSKRTPYFKEYNWVLFGTLSVAVGSPAEKLFIGTPTHMLETYVGFCVFAAGLFLRYIGRRQLRHRFTVQIVPGNELVTDGVYAYVRHPLYLGLLLIVLSSPLIMNGIISLVYTYTFMPFVIYRRIKKEEALLLNRFGDLYLEYMKKVPAIFPFKLGKG